METHLSLLKEVVEKATKEEDWIGKNKVVIVVSQDKVNIKMVPPPKPRKKHISRLTKEEQDRMKEIKTTLKKDLDLLNLVTLLMRLKEEVRRIKLTSLEPVKLKTIASVYKDITREFNVKQLT